MDAKNAKLRELEKKFKDLSDEHERLFDIKISLERELEVYRNLLAGRT